MSLSEVVDATDLKGLLRKGFWFCVFFFFPPQCILIAVDRI